MSDNPDSRNADYDLIEKALKGKNDIDRRQAKLAKDRIDSESRKLRALRQELVEAHRSNNKGKIEELHHRIREEDRYGR